MFRSGRQGTDGTLTRQREDAVDGGRRRTGRMAAQLVACCGVLLGLFLMHGSPSAAAYSCHAVTARVAASAATLDIPVVHTAPAGTDLGGMVAGHGGRAATTAPGMSVPTASGVGAAPAAPTDRTAVDASCLSTPARDRPSLPGMGPAVPAFVLLGAVGGAAAAGSRQEWQEPSATGRAMLTRKCVART